MAHLSLEERKLYAEVFLEVDQDGNGWLNKTELAVEVFPQMGIKFPSEDMIDELFTHVDVNGDGKITLDEFLLVCEKLDPVVRKTAEVCRAFKRANVKVEGGLTEEEFLQLANDNGVALTEDDVSEIFLTAEKDTHGRLLYMDLVKF